MHYNEPIKKVLKNLKSKESGLTQKDAGSRLGIYGKNKIRKAEEIHPFRIFLSQFRSFIVYILIAAVIISLLINEYVDAAVIFIILLFNALFGFIQEYKAEKSIDELRKLASQKAKVIRDGKTVELNTEKIVPGDIIMIEVGEKIPADARLIKISNLQTQESALTGESLPVKKEIFEFPDDTAVADRKNMIYSGTIATEGHGKAVVTATGMNTEIGKIAGLIQETQDDLTPLQKKLKVLGERLGAVTILICLIVIGLGVLRGGGLFHWLLIGVSLAVAAIPEGLPAVVTISLALGVQRMVKKNSLIRKLPSVETLGATTVICTDKTGTLTCNEMTVKRIWANEKIYEVTGEGYSKKGGFIIGKNLADTKNITRLLRLGALCNNSEIVDGKVVGDPTEGALIVSAAKAGLEGAEKYPRIDEIGFTSERKMMTTVHDAGKKKLLASKGAPEVILDRCDRILVNGKVKRLTRADKRKMMDVNKEFAGSALRVLGFAYKEIQGREKVTEKGMIFTGLQGMMDPPRNEAKQAIRRCRKAGIKVIMITGDFEVTAKAIADELGIKGDILTGQKVDKMPNLENYVERIAVFARVNPEHKIKIVDALRKKGHIVAMTGDGVNDAPALKKADIGVAMGITGTDVSKEASDMILTDDNFSSIVNAVEEGRGIYDNIKKFVNYLLSSNLGEVMILLVAMLIGFTGEGGEIIVPLIAIQILWLNIVTDGLPALALGVDPASPKIMERKPRNPKTYIITKNMALNILTIGVLMTVSVLFLFNLHLDDSVELARTIAFTALVVLQVVRVYMVRHEYNVGFFENKYFTLAIISSLLLQAAVIYTPLNRIFETVPLTLMHWLEMIAVAAVMFAAGAIAARFIRKLTHEEY